MADNIPDFMQGFDNINFDYGFKAVSEEEVDQAKKQTETLQQVSETSANLEPKLQELESKLEQILEISRQQFDYRLEEKELELELSNKEKFSSLEQLILPLLYNLGKSDENYIYWPNRKQVIEEQINKILQITRTTT